MSQFGITALKWLAVLVVLGNLWFLATQARKEWLRSDRRAEAESPGQGAPKPPAFEVGKDFIKFNASSAEAYGLETEAAKACSWQERVAVQGRVVPSPRATYEIRSPFAGTLCAVAETPWPLPGQTVRPGQALACVAVRVAPLERLDLRTKLADATLTRQGAEEVLQLRQAAVERLSKAPSAVLAQRELDEAQVQLADARTQLAKAKAAVELWQQALDEIDRIPTKAGGTWSRPLLAPGSAEVGGGELEVVELAAQPGAAVEAGGLVAKLVDFSRPLVRLDLPAELLAQGPPPKEVHLSPAPTVAPALRGASNRPEMGKEDAPATAALIGPAPQVDGPSQYVGYYYQVRDGALDKAARQAWRPGFFVQAQLPSSSAPRDAVSVPAGAVLYHQGRALVYLKVEPGKYQRREVQVLGREGGRCVVTARSEFLPPVSPPTRDLSADDLVVVQQAQVLLALEFRRDSDDD